MSLFDMYQWKADSIMAPNNYWGWRKTLHFGVFPHVQSFNIHSLYMYIRVIESWDHLWATSFLVTSWALTHLFYADKTGEWLGSLWKSSLCLLCLVNSTTFAQYILTNRMVVVLATLQSIGKEWNHSLRSKCSWPTDNLVSFSRCTLVAYIFGT